MLPNSCPNLPPLSAIERLYPFQTFLPKEGIESVQDTLTAFQLNAGSAGDGLCTLENVRHSPDSKCAVDIAVDGTKHTIEVPSGKKPSGTVEGSGYVPTFYHDSFVAELMLSHAGLVLNQFYYVGLLLILIKVWVLCQQTIKVLFFTLSGDLQAPCLHTPDGVLYL